MDSPICRDGKWTQPRGDPVPASIEVDFLTIDRGQVDFWDPRKANERDGGGICMPQPRAPPQYIFLLYILI